MLKTAIITGGGGGIGGECAKVFSSNGYNCVLVDLNMQNAQGISLEIEKENRNHLALEADVSKPVDIEAVVNKTLDKYGRIDALVNCAATNRMGLDASDNIEERWDKTIDNDLKSVYLMSERVVIEMANNNGGAIVNIGSIAGLILGSQSVPYAAAKAGIVGITKSHARIYGKYGIRVNCILPGIIETRMVKGSEKEGALRYFSTIREQTPLKRWGQPIEIADMIYFAASDKCGFLTGATIVVDGGATLTLGPRLDEELPFKWEKWPAAL